MDGGGGTILDWMASLSSSSEDSAEHGPHAQPECGPHKPSQQVQVRILKKN